MKLGRRDGAWVFGFGQLNLHLWSGEPTSAILGGFANLKFDFFGAGPVTMDVVSSIVGVRPGLKNFRPGRADYSIGVRPGLGQSG